MKTEDERITKYTNELYHGPLTRFELCKEIARLEAALDKCEERLDSILSDIPKMGGH